MTLINKSTDAEQELSPVIKHISLENMRLYSGWINRNVHTDWETAKAAGLTAPIAQGLMSNAYIREMLANSFGRCWFEGGKLSTTFVRSVVPGETITARGIIREKIPEGDAVKFSIEVWCENGFGDKVTVGTACVLLR